MRLTGLTSGPNLILPSGASLYFVRAGDLVWMMSFSGPALPRELAAGMRQLETTPLMVDLLDGLSPTAEALVAGMLRTSAKRSILSASCISSRA